MLDPTDTQPIVSPTGVPVIPVSVVPWLILAAGAAQIAMPLLEDGTWNMMKTFKLIAGLLTLAVGATPGLRK